MRSKQCHGIEHVYRCVDMVFVNAVQSSNPSFARVLLRVCIPVLLLSPPNFSGFSTLPESHFQSEACRHAALSTATLRSCQVPRVACLKAWSKAAVYDRFLLPLFFLLAQRPHKSSRNVIMSHQASPSSFAHCCLEKFLAGVYCLSHGRAVHIVVQIWTDDNTSTHDAPCPMHDKNSHRTDFRRPIWNNAGSDQ